MGFLTRSTRRHTSEGRFVLLEAREPSATLVRLDIELEDGDITCVALSEPWLPPWRLGEGVGGGLIRLGVLRPCVLCMPVCPAMREMLREKKTRR